VADPGPEARSTSVALARSYRAGRDAHPRLDVGLDAYAERWRACVDRRRARGGTAAADDEAPEATRAADLYLAAACLAGAAGSWERLHETHADRLAALARSRGAPPLEAEHQVAELVADVVVPREGRPPMLAQYDASGSLFGWLGTCLLRRLSARSRAADATRPLPEAPIADRGAADPARVALRSELEERLRRALRDAVDALTPQERGVLVLVHRDGWAGKDVARLLGVGAPRASRLRTQAVEKVRSALLPVLRSEGGRGAEAGTWEALRDAVGLALAPVAIPTPPAPPRGEDPRRRDPHG
jgi:RNA polymerase sigma factor (sigma-70 family)